MGETNFKTNSVLVASLSQPPRYFPIERGLYEVAPGLKPLGTNFGNGPMDQIAFQIDCEFSRYRDNKLKARAENLAKYHGIANLAPEARRESIQTLIRLMASEHPNLFLSETDEANDRIRFESKLTGESFVFSLEGDLLESNSNVRPPYQNAFDALLSQVQEDTALVSRNQQGADWLSVLHVTSPSHWDPSEKLGRDFFYVHQPIPGADRLIKARKSLVEAMIHKGPFVRFVWSFVTDTHLNHHPSPPPGEDPVQWRGRSFDSSAEIPFFLRIERQVILGLPNVQSSIFLIRVSFLDGRSIRSHPEQKNQLVKALHSMSPESRAYKGVAQCFSELIDWLN